MNTDLDILKFMQYMSNSSSPHKTHTPFSPSVSPTPFTVPKTPNTLNPFSTGTGTSTPFSTGIDTGKSTTIDDYRRQMERMMESMHEYNKRYDPDISLLHPMSMSEIIDFVFNEFIHSGKILNSSNRNLYSHLMHCSTITHMPNFNTDYYNNSLNINNNSFISNNSTRSTYHKLIIINSETYIQHNKDDSIILNADKTRYINTKDITVDQTRINDPFLFYPKTKINVFIHVPNIQHRFTFTFNHTEKTNIGFNSTIDAGCIEYQNISTDELLRLRSLINGNTIMCLMENDAQGTESLSVDFEIPACDKQFSTENIPQDILFMLNLLNYNATIIPVLEIVSKKYELRMY